MIYSPKVISTAFSKTNAYESKGILCIATEQITVDLFELDIHKRDKEVINVIVPASKFILVSCDLLQIILD
jgi:hypothetical protein